MIREQAAMLKEYEEKQRALEAQKNAEEERRRQQELQQQMEMEEKQRQQAERERLAEEQLRLQHIQQFNDQNAQVVNQLQMEMLAMRGQFERDQIMLEQYDRVRPYLSFSLSFCVQGLTRVTESQNPRGRVARDERRRGRPNGYQG
jgi:DNA repair ATPase RecN